MPATTHPGFPGRPLLSPGVRVCRRRDGHLQVGLEAGRAVVAPDTAPVRELLAGLRHGVPPAPPAALAPAAARLCADLLAAGLVVDGDALLTGLGACRTPGERASLAAAHAEHGTATAAVLAHRSAVAVTVHHRQAPREAATCAALLASAGLGGPAADPDLVVHLSTGEPDRDLLDTWSRADLPHLLVTTVEGRVRLGPFVAPGRTACLRCVDAHHTERDPRRPVVLEQYAAARDAAPGGVPEPVPQDLVELALIWAVRDACAWADGREPRTWSSTVEVDPRLALTRTRWRPHPGCGCSWGLTAAG